MTYLAIYLAIGCELVAYAVLRDPHLWSLCVEDVCTLVGLALLWPIVVCAEAISIVRDR